MKKPTEKTIQRFPRRRDPNRHPRYLCFEVESLSPSLSPSAKRPLCDRPGDPHAAGWSLCWQRSPELEYDAQEMLCESHLWERMKRLILEAA
jgi:hypothetical protein